MAENNLRSSRGRDLSSRDPSSLDPVSRDPIARGSASRDAASDPLAELARLIGRSDPGGEQRHNPRENQAQAAENRAPTEGANWRAGGRSAQEHSNQERLAQERLAQERLAQERLAQERVAQERFAQERLAQGRFAPERAAQERAAQERAAQERAAQERAAQERAPQGYNQERYSQERYNQERYNQERYNQERYNRYGEQGESADDHRYAVPPTSAYPDEPSHGDFADELPPPVRLSGGRGGRFSTARDASRGARFPDEQTPHIADPRHGPPAFFGDSESDHDDPNDAEYGGEGDAYAAEDAEEEYEEYYEDEEDNGYPRRSGTKVLTAVLGLAILATAGAFGYRTIFAGSVLPSLPPVIKPADGPTKIKPSHDAQADAAKGSTATDDGADTKLVTHEEQPVDIPPPQDGPRVVSTVPVFPNPNSPSPSANGSGFPPEQFPPQQPPQASTVVASAAPKPASAPPAAPVAAPTSPTPKKIHTVSIRAPQASGPAATSNAPLPLVPANTAARTHTASAAAEPVPAETPPPRTGTASAAESAPTEAPAAPGYDVQVTSQRSEDDAKTEFQALQAKFPTQLGSRTPIIRRADLGAKGVYYRALVGPFASSEEAAGMCSSLKAAGGNCLVQRN